jgi:hypothetical protein
MFCLSQCCNGWTTGNRFTTWDVVICGCGVWVLWIFASFQSHMQGRSDQRSAAGKGHTTGFRVLERRDLRATVALQ